MVKYNIPGDGYLLKMSIILMYADDADIETFNHPDTQAMLTTRNIFIANLAVSDILLCSVSMPTCLADILTNYWTFGTDFVSFRNSRALFVRSSENSAMMPIVEGCQSLMFY